MAEYYPLLARAVAGLKTSTPQARRAIYERARGALLAQLRAMTPPIAEPDIQRESDALDAAIARLEAEMGASAPEQAEPPADGGGAAQEADAAPAAKTAQEAQAAKAAQDARAAEAAQAAQAARAAAEAKAAEARAAEEERRAQAIAAAQAKREHDEQEARLAREKTEREARERIAAEQAVARRREEIERAAEAAGVSEPLGLERPRASAGITVPVKPPASAPHKPAPPPPPSAPEVFVIDEPSRDPTAAPAIAILAPVADESAGADRFTEFAAARQAPEDFAAQAPELEGDQRNRPSRPAAPLPPPERRSNMRHIVAGATLALVMGGIGYAAWVLRDKPQELPRPITAAATPAQQPAETGSKISDRATTAPSSPVPIVQAPAQTIRPAGAPPAPAPAAPEQLAPARAAFLIQSEGPEQHKTFSGVVNWRVENGVWRGDVTSPDAKLTLTFAMSKATDGGPASHKIDLRFQFDDPTYQIGRVGVPEMRKEENPYGDRLAAVAVPVTANVYLIGLRKDDADIAYNLELIRSRGWIDIPMEMADKRIAKVTFEKGPAGDATFAEAVKGW